MTVVYLDRVVLLNLAVDYLLLLATARLAGLPLRRRRLGLCAALGAAYAAAVFLPGCTPNFEGELKKVSLIPSLFPAPTPALSK